MKIQRFLLGLMVLMFVGMVGSAGTPVRSAETIPVTFDKYGRMLLPVEIYGRMQVRHFLFDTAARYPVFLNRDSGALGIKFIEKGTLNHYDSAGLTRLPVAWVDAYMLGERVVEEAIVGFFPDWAEHDGLIGNTPFHGRIVHWQPEKKQLNIYPNLAPISKEGWLHLGGRTNRFFGMVVRTEYRGLEFDVVIATGSNRSLISHDIVAEIFPDFWEARRLNGGAPEVEIMRALSPQPEKRAPVPMPGFAIGGWEIEGFEPVSFYLNSRDLTGYMNANVIVLGADVLSRYEVAYDFRDFHLWVRNPAQ